MSAKEEFNFFHCSGLIEVYSHQLICSLLIAKISANEIYYYGKILGETDFTLVQATGNLL